MVKRLLTTLDSILLSVLLGTILGILYGSLAPIAPWIHIMILGAIFIFCGYSLIRKNKRAVVFVCIASFSFLFGYERFVLSLPDMRGSESYVGEKVLFQGVVIEEPDEKEYGVQFVLDVGRYNILVSTDASTDIVYGDEVTVRGTVLLPENFKTNQGTDFDYVSYLYKDNIVYRMQSADVHVLSHDNGNALIAKLIPVKNWVVRGFHSVFPKNEADLLAGLNLGEKSAIDAQFRDDLITTGTIHMIALSGYNVTIIVSALREFFVDILGLSVYTASIMGGIGVVLFVILTGLQSSAVRAGIMALIGIIARTEGRPYHVFRALLFAGFCMLMWNPKYLMYDVSFQLSFLATLGIIFITPLLERRFARIPKKFLFIIPLREALAVTLGAQIAVLPFIVYTMGTLSLIALPANIIILPAVPYTMGFGFLSGLLGTISHTFAYPFVLVTHGLLSYITYLVEFFADVPFASLVIKHIPLSLCLGIYALLIYFVSRGWYKKSHT